MWEPYGQVHRYLTGCKTSVIRNTEFSSKKSFANVTVFEITQTYMYLRKPQITEVVTLSAVTVDRLLNFILTHL
jgi:hypothetical protein